VYVDPGAVLQVLSALFVLANTLVTLWTNRKVAGVSTKVDGLATQAIAGAELKGIVRGAGVTLPLPSVPPPSTP
jgi:hypothetical protein